MKKSNKLTPVMIRRRLRALVGCSPHDTLPVWVVDGVDAEQEPYYCGEKYHWETRGGERIEHPSAYSKVGWSNMVYCHSTHRVEVGHKWLESAGISPSLVHADRPTTYVECPARVFYGLHG